MDNGGGDFLSPPAIKLVSNERPAVNNLRLVLRGARDLALNSEAAAIVEKGYRLMYEGESAVPEVNNFFSYLEKQGVPVVPDKPNLLGRLYTTSQNLMRVKKGRLLIHPDLWGDFQEGHIKACDRLLRHGFHEFAAIVGERRVAPRGKIGLATFVRFADAFLEERVRKNTSFEHTYDIKDAFEIAKKTAEKQFGIKVDRELELIRGEVS